MRHPALLGLALGALVVGSAARYHSPRSAPPACDVRGVWDLVEFIQAGNTTPLAGMQQRKIVTAKYYTWLRQDMRRDTLPMKTETDTLRAYFTMGGSGTYSVSGDTYTEHLEYFNDPTLVGKTFAARCRIDGNRWYHMYDSGQLAQPGAAHDTVTEVYTRVE